MHEIRMIKDLVKDLLKHGKKVNAKKITKVYVKMGEMTEIDPDIFKFHFFERIKGTPAEGCELEMEQSQTRELRLMSFDCE